MQVDPTDILRTGEVRIPAGVDATTPEQKQLYAAALEFERFFVSHLMKQMQSATQALHVGSDDESGPGSAGTGAYKDMAQDQLTQAVLDGGGLGLASMLYDQVAAPLPAGKAGKAAS